MAHISMGFGLHLGNFLLTLGFRWSGRLCVVWPFILTIHLQGKLCVSLAMAGKAIPIGLGAVCF